MALRLSKLPILSRIKPFSKVCYCLVTGKLLSYQPHDLYILLRFTRKFATAPHMIIGVTIRDKEIASPHFSPDGEKCGLDIFKNCDFWHITFIFNWYDLFCFFI